MYFRWMFPLWDGEAEGGGGGSGDKAGAEGGDKGSGGDAGDKAATSLRAQLAGHLDEGEREGFNKWAETYPTDKDFVKSTLIMRSQFDQRVPVPGEKSKPEEWDKYFQRVGKPPAAKDYKYDPPKGEDGKPIEMSDSDVARIERFKERAHKHHYTQAQFSEGLAALEEDIQAQNANFDAQIIAARGKSEETLKSEWGPDFEANIAAAVDGGVAYAPSEQDWIAFTELPLANGMKVGDHPTLLRTMAKIGRASGEDQRVRNMEQSGEATNIKAEIEKIEQEAMDKGHMTSSEPYHSKLMPLYAKLYPKKHTVQMGGGGFGSR